MCAKTRRVSTSSTSDHLLTYGGKNRFKMVSMKRMLCIGLVMVALAGCGVDVDSPKTPTVIPTSTIDETVVALLSTRTPTITPSPTETASATATLTATATLEPSATATLTASPTATNTHTATPSTTRTPQPTATARPTDTATATPTFTPTPSATITASATWTLQPSATLEPSATATLAPSATLIPSATASRIPTITPAPITTTPIVFPTLPPSSPQPGPSATQSGTFYDPNATAQQTSVAVAPPGETGPTGPALPAQQDQVVVSYAGQVVPLLGLNPSGSPVTNPMANGTIFTVNGNGDVAAVGQDHLLYVNNGPLVVSPASVYGLDPNLTYGDLVWSPNGQRLAFRLDAAEQSHPNAIDSGVWVYDPGQMLPTWQAFRNTYAGQAAQLDGERQALAIRWSPDSGSLAIIVQTPLGRGTVFTSAMHQANDPVMFAPYADANWTPDSKSLMVSGLGFDGYTVVGRLDESTNWTYTEILNQRTTGLYMQAATRLNDGWIAFLAGPTPDSFALYTTPPVSGMPLAPQSATINGQILSAEWNLARSAVLVTVQTMTGQRELWIVRTDGTVENATPGTPGFPDVAHWR